MLTSYVFTLDIKPVSVNAAYRSGPRFKTQAYRDFEEYVATKVMIDKNLRGLNLSMPLEVEYRVYAKNYKRIDVGNFEKTCTDSLVAAGVLEDDHWIDVLIMRKYPSNTDYIQVIIKPYSMLNPGSPRCP